MELEYTYFGGSIANSDFTESTVYNVLFKTGTEYWLATRYSCHDSLNGGAEFGLRTINSSSLYGRTLFLSVNPSGQERKKRVAPIVHLGPEIQVTKGTNASSTSGAHTVVVP